MIRQQKHAKGQAVKLLHRQQFTRFIAHKWKLLPSNKCRKYKVEEHFLHVFTYQHELLQTKRETTRSQFLTLLTKSDTLEALMEVIIHFFNDSPNPQKLQPPQKQPQRQTSYESAKPPYAGLSLAEGNAEYMKRLETELGPD